MNSLAAITFVACLAAANASWLHGPSAQVIQGPSSKTTLVGPEGSVISAVAPGGQIVHEEQPGYVAHAAPVHSYAVPVVSHAAPSHSHVVAYTAPAVAHASHVVAHAAPVLAHVARSTVVAHASAHNNDNVVVAGPSGIISTGHSAHAPIVAHAAPVVGHAAPLAYGVLESEGQYIHDHSESLYDDGSYKPHVYHY